MQDPMKVSKTTTVTIFLMDETIFLYSTQVRLSQKKKTIITRSDRLLSSVKTGQISFQWFLKPWTQYIVTTEMM
jgi:hypothetical protein